MLKDRPITLRVPTKMAEQLQKLADAERRKLSDYLYLTLSDHLERVHLQRAGLERKPERR